MTAELPDSYSVTQLGRSSCGGGVAVIGYTIGSFLINCSFLRTDCPLNRFFFYTYILLFPFVNILAFCFIPVIAFFFLFIRDTDLRKGTLCPFCVPIHKKEEDPGSSGLSTWSYSDSDFLSGFGLYQESFFLKQCKLFVCGDVTWVDDPLTKPYLAEFLELLEQNNVTSCGVIY